MVGADDKGLQNGIPNIEGTRERLALPGGLVTLFRAIVPPTGRVALAEPTVHGVTDAVLAAGRRYVDVGRDARFRVHKEGLAFALREQTTSAVYLADPDDPTSTRPHASWVARAARSRCTLIVDRRYDLPDHVGPEAITILGIDRKEVVHLLASEPWVPLLRTAGARTSTYRQGYPPRASPRGLWLLASQRPGLQLERPKGPRFWLRVPGIPSATIAAYACSTAVEGSTAWTWRDAVAIRPLPLVAAKRLLDALEACR